MKITARTVAGLKLPRHKNDAIYFDDDMPGFGIRLRASGQQVRRSWVAQYRSFGRTRRVLLGSAEILGAEQARAAAKKVLARVTLGHDPQAEKAARRQKDTHSLKSVVGDYLASKQKTVRPRTYAEIVRYLTGHFFKPLHNVPIDQITRRDVAARLTNHHGKRQHHCQPGEDCIERILCLGHGPRAGRIQSGHRNHKTAGGEAEGSRSFGRRTYCHLERLWRRRLRQGDQASDPNRRAPRRGRGNAME
jgi:Arm domain-containing DNA-binding protein